jgi:putative hydrolase of HD superfamily
MNARVLCALIDTGAKLGTLKRLPRTGWLQRGVADPESIAEHSYSVAMLALLAGDAVPGLDRERLLRMALLHDYAEALMGDLPASAKRLIGAPAKHAGERRAMSELLADFPAGESYVALWQEYCDGRSREAQLLKALDRIEMLMQALEYERAGSRLMDEFWDDVELSWPEWLPELRELALMLHARRPSFEAVMTGNGMRG